MRTKNAMGCRHKSQPSHCGAFSLHSGASQWYGHSWLCSVARHHQEIAWRLHSAAVVSWPPVFPLNFHPLSPARHSPQSTFSYASRPYSAYPLSLGSLPAAPPPFSPAVSPLSPYPAVFSFFSSCASAIFGPFAAPECPDTTPSKALTVSSHLPVSVCSNRLYIN